MTLLIIYLVLAWIAGGGYLSEIERDSTKREKTIIFILFPIIIPLMMGVWMAEKGNDNSNLRSEIKEEIRRELLESVGEKVPLKTKKMRFKFKPN